MDNTDHGRAEFIAELRALAGRVNLFWPHLLL